MNKKTGLILLIVVLVLSAGAWFWFHQVRVVSPPSSTMTREEAVNLLGQRGELGLKRKINAPLIATYEKMLLQYPESLDLKRKLAAAYEASGDHEKAQKILDEINLFRDPSRDKKAPPP